MPNFKQQTVTGQGQLQNRILELAGILLCSRTRAIKLLSYLRCYSSLMFDVLADPRGLLCNAVAVQAVDLVLYGQGFCLLVFVSYNHSMRDN